MNYNKNVESSIKYLKSKIPHIIYGVKSSLDSFSDTFLDIHNTVIKLNKDRKLEKSSIEKLNTDSFYMNKIFNINPIALLASTGDANRFTSFFDNYFKIIEKFEESQDPIDYYNEDLGISTPRLMNFDISLMASEMTLLNSPSLNEEKVPKIAIKSLENAEISKFLRKIIYDDTIKAECYHEFLLGQIDISSLSSMIVKIYYDTMFSKEFKDSVDIFSVTKYLNNSFMSSGLTTFVNNPSFSFNKESYVFNIFNNDIYGAFIFLNHIIQSNDNFATMDIGDSTIDKIENFISDIRSLIEKRVDKLINRTIVSAIITYLAKVELSKNYTYLDLNYGFIKELIQVTKEEINEVKSECFNHGLDDHIHNHMKGEILQKRIFDFVSLIANLHSAGKINSLNYNEFLRFIERIIPEIYSNETYLTNSINKEINIDLIIQMKHT